MILVSETWDQIIAIIPIRAEIIRAVINPDLKGKSCKDIFPWILTSTK